MMGSESSRRRNHLVGRSGIGASLEDLSQKEVTVFLSSKETSLDLHSQMEEKVLFLISTLSLAHWHPLPTQFHLVLNSMCEKY